jgi:putative ABC transport system substrate-binding protein
MGWIRALRNPGIIVLGVLAACAGTRESQRTDTAGGAMSKRMLGLLLCLLIGILLGFAMVGGAAAAQAIRPPGLPRVGFLGMDSKLQVEMRQAFEAGMRARGYVEGKNVEYVWLWAEGDFVRRLPALAAEMVARKVNVIVTLAPPAVKAAQSATRTIPIVMGVHNILDWGLADSFAHPGRNITGVAFQDSELSAKRLDLLRQFVPDLKRVAVIWNLAGGGRQTVDAVSSAAAQMGIEILPLEVSAPQELERAVTSARAWNAQAVLQLASPVISQNRKVLLDALATHRLPAACERKQYVEEGCLMTYSSSYPGTAQRLAYFTDRILKGEKVTALPIEQPREFELVINRTTASKLGLSIPAALQILANEVLH